MVSLPLYLDCVDESCTYNLTGAYAADWTKDWSRIGVLSKIKNEAEIIREWMEHHIAEGISVFVLIDNNSSDGTSDVIRSVAGNQSDVVVALKRRTRESQETMHLFGELLPVIRKIADWVLPIDPDEFVYLRGNKFSHLPHFFHSLNSSISQVLLPYKLFGSSGHLSHPDGISSHFFKRMYNCNSETTINHLDPGPFDGGRTHPLKGLWCKGNRFVGKAAVRTESLLKLRLHCHHVRHRTVDSYQGHRPGHWYGKCDEDILASSVLHLNHYILQSWERYAKIKLSRGEPEPQLQWRSKKTYLQMDMDLNTVWDTELALKQCMRFAKNHTKEERYRHCRWHYPL